jgi:flagellar motility protein MotE (MotC chaperone)
MDATWAAIVTGAFGLLMLLIEKGRRENVRDHGFVKERLDGIKSDIADLDEDLSVIEAKIDNHLSDHVAASLDVQPTKKRAAKNGK